MITRISQHWVLPDKLEESIKVFAEWGQAARSAPGWVQRQVIQSVDDPLEITTLTTFRSREDFKKWLATPERDRVAAPRGLWSKPAIERYHEVLPEI